MVGLAVGAFEVGAAVAIVGAGVAIVGAEVAGV